MNPEIPQEKVSITVSCFNLPRSDSFSRSDPYCEVSIKDLSLMPQQQHWQLIGKSETLPNNSNPSFTKEFIVDFKFEIDQLIRVRMFDNDFGESRDDFLGETEFKLGTLMGSRGQQLHVNFLSRSRMVLQARSVSETSSQDLLHLTLQARKLDAKDGFLFKSDPFFEIVSPTNNNLVLYRSEYLTQTLNPKWKPVAIPLNRLKENSFTLTVTDWDKDGTHDLIGSATVSVSDCLQRKHDIPLIHPPTKAKYKSSSYSNSGYVDIVESKLEKNYSFLDFLRGGLSIQLMVAVDFTASNGDPNLPESNHYFVNNPYLHAIQSIGNICLEYDSDKFVQAFGFGAKPTPYQSVSHCFPLSPESEYVCGMDGVAKAYRQCFERGLVLFGPTYFAPVIHRCTEIAMQHQAGSYSVLLIITDGEIIDMQQTIDAIVFAAKSAPLSIIITGVGRGSNFASMSMLDGDGGVPLRSSQTGELCCRDIVQFVPFSLFQGNSGQLASETLREIPRQVTEYFKWRGVAPNPPIEIPIATAGVQVVTAPHTPLGEVGRDLLRGAVSF